MTDKDLAILSHAIYAKPQKVKWDYFSGELSSIVYGLLAEGDSLVVVFRGTADLPDLLRDIGSVVPDPKACASLGVLGLGFYLGIPHVAQVIGEFMEARKLTKVVVTGHSLGAVRAVLLGAELLEMEPPGGITSLSVVAFGVPGVSIGPQIADLFSNAKVPARLYRNRLKAELDPVTLLPPDLLRPAPFIDISIGPPRVIELFDPLELHSSARYALGVPDTEVNL